MAACQTLVLSMNASISRAVQGRSHCIQVGRRAVRVPKDKDEVLLRSSALSSSKAKTSMDCWPCLLQQGMKLVLPADLYFRMMQQM